MLSLGTELDFALAIASANVGLPAGSPPPVRAATSTFLMSFANSFPRRASTTAFLCLVVAHLLCPLIWVHSSGSTHLARLTAGSPSQRRRTVHAHASRPSAPDGTPWPATALDAPRRFYRPRGRARRPRSRTPPPTGP